MSQWAREHPELCAEGVTAYDWYADRADDLRQRRKDEPCPACGGKGHAPKLESVRCPTCKGAGVA